ncbi:MAG: hypothetical protein HYY52_01110 [Candidatus Melainabacteria bacterium]|nr:hypothetical protein [Candidatus Melainabacteria bacterium]
MVVASKIKDIKPVDVIEITTAVPQEQVNTLRQMIIRYILDHNSEEVAYKLLDLAHTRLRDDVRFYQKNTEN